MNVKAYIDSGILESYVLGAASAEETAQLLQLKELYPEISYALMDLEVDMERMAQYMSVTPPPAMWNRINEEMNKEMVLYDIPKVKEYTANDYSPKGDTYIAVEAESTTMTIHKNWKWVLAAVFVLSKIFLGCAIYFYLENRQAQEQILQLKSQVQQLPK